MANTKEFFVEDQVICVEIYAGKLFNIGGDNELKSYDEKRNISCGNRFEYR